MSTCKSWLAANSSKTGCDACRVSTGGASFNVVVPRQSAHCNGSDCDYNSGIVCPLMPLTYGGQLAEWSGPPPTPPASTPSGYVDSPPPPAGSHGSTGSAGHVEKSSSRFASAAISADSESSFTSSFALARQVV
ncbi:hypothetical protein F503_03633 [Ophiostoma piceae UAMH 11346]|uniref:Uncharacterized protein n=1 Tax=Ophiostoma piceae (strain UAMH 11346) TaxID=1262450 RepID=S3BYL0_OPHP1|nr:hypothetical protein F503_03633 [Ophiostoma piceae UAMH 11346]